MALNIQHPNVLIRTETYKRRDGVKVKEKEAGFSPVFP